MIINTIIKILFPDKCPFCGKFIDENEQSCKKCRKKVERINIQCRTHGDFLCYSSFPYHTHYKDAILILKSRKYPSKSLGEYLAKTIKEEYRDMHFDIVSSVPLHKNKLKKRGYNQAGLLAKVVSKKLDIPYKEVLIKTRDTKNQHNLKGRERFLNIKNAYKVKDKELIRNKNILLIDDIITTGCTLGECSRTLWESGANTVSCATVCRV